MCALVLLLLVPFIRFRPRRAAWTALSLADAGGEADNRNVQSSDESFDQLNSTAALQALAHRRLREAGGPLPDTADCSRAAEHCAARARDAEQAGEVSGAVRWYSI
eukprot:EG_transcript_46409